MVMWLNFSFSFFIYEGEYGGHTFATGFVLSPHCVMYGDGRDLITDL